jgi:two-component system KDP operon response regulator KdpE
MPRILVVDDDPALLRTLTINLRARGYDVETAGDGRSALQVVPEQRPDLVLLDLGLPDLDGVEVLRRLRTLADLPVLVLSARHTSDDKVEALDLGADDYITKPFGMDELLARIRSALRRSPAALDVPARVVEAGDLRLDIDDHRASRAGQPVHLTPTEWRMVEVLTRTPGQLVRQTELLREVWGPHYHRETNYLRVYLANLRRKLETDPARPRHFLTEPGVGYRFIAHPGR